MVMVIPSSLSSRHNLFAKEPNVNNDGESPENDDNINVKTTIKINDGGSDLTDRFKYKVGENNFYINAEIAQNKISNFAPHLSQVNALMGVFDPQGEDTDQQNGNILNAMLSFPVNYSFNVVGKTMGDQKQVDQFVEKVKAIVLETTGDTDGIETLITPRTKNFTKVSVQANVESAAMIARIYEQLKEISVMRF